MVLLDLAYHTEFCCESMETFLIGGLRKILVHIGPLVVLPCCGCRKVYSGIADSI